MVLKIDSRLACLLVGVIISTFDYSVLTIALPTLSQSFSIAASEAQMATSLYLVGSGLSFIPVALLANLWGSARVFRASLLIFSLLSFALVFTKEFNILLLLRFLQGIAGSGIVGLVPALAAAAFPSRRAWVLSLVISASALGTLVGPPLGGFAVQFLGWQSVFLLNLPLGLLAFFLSHNLPELAEIKLKYAVKKLLSVPKLFLALMASMLFFAHTFATIIIVPFYLADRGYTPIHTSIYLLIPSLITLLSGSWSGIQADKFGLKKITILGAVILFISTCWQGITSDVLIGAIGLGLGRCFFQAANSAEILSLAPTGTESLASSFLSITRVLGQAFGSAIAGFLWTILISSGSHSAFAIANFLLALLALLSGILVYIR